MKISIFGIEFYSNIKLNQSILNSSFFKRFLVDNLAEVEKWDLRVTRITMIKKSHTVTLRVWPDPKFKFGVFGNETHHKVKCPVCDECKQFMEHSKRCKTGIVTDVMSS